MLLIPLRLGLTDINEAYVGTLKVGLRRAHAARPEPPRALLCAKAFPLPQPSDCPLLHPALHLGLLAALLRAPCPRACLPPASVPAALGVHGCPASTCSARSLPSLARLWEATAPALSAPGRAHLRLWAQLSSTLGARAQRRPRPPSTAS